MTYSLKTSADGTIFSTTTGMGTIKNEKVNKDSQLFQQPMPGATSAQTIVLDLFGATKMITVDGVFYDTANMVEFITELEGLVSGSQTHYHWTSDLYTVINICVLSVSWQYIGGEPTHIEYTINMIEGTGA